MIFAKHLAQWSIPTLLETMSKAGLMALAAYFLPKSDFGIFTLAMLVFSFHPLLQLGLVDGIIIKLPGYFIKNEEFKMKASLGLSLTFSLIIVAVLMVAILAYGLVVNVHNKTLLICGVFLSAAIPYQIYNHYLLLNRYNYSLQVTLYARVLNAAQRVMIQFPLLYFFGVYGIVIGEVIIYAVSACFLLCSSESHVIPNLDKNRFRKLLAFGFPLWTISLLTMIAASFERSVSAYYFDLESIADIGLIVFFGALFLQVFGQVLSLFSQYSREFYVKNSALKSLVSAFFVYSHSATLVYILSACLFYAIASHVVIPEYLPEYRNAIGLLPITYAIFFVRIIWAILFSLLTIVGERKKLVVGKLVFLGSASSLILLNAHSALTLENLLISVLIGSLLEIAFIITVCSHIAKDLGSGAIILLCSLILGLAPLYLITLNEYGWLLNIIVSLGFLGVSAFLLFFVGRENSKLTDFKSIIRRQY